VTRPEGRRQTRRPSASGPTGAPDGRPGRTAGRATVGQVDRPPDFQRALAIFRARLALQPQIVMFMVVTAGTWVLG
jgi:hypothetical protein